MSGGVPVVRHVHQDRVLKPLELVHSEITVNLGELGMVIVYDMFSLELGSVLIKSVCHEDGYVVEPSISWSSRE